MRWILDDTPFGHLALVRPSLVASWEPGYLLVAEATARPMLNNRQDSVAALIDPANGPAPVSRFEIATGTTAWANFLELHSDLEEEADMAEHESISWAQSEAPDTVFVSVDKGAIMIALAELGRERVASPFDLWIDLFRRRWLVESEFVRLCDHSYGQAKDLLQGKPKRIVEMLTQIPAADLPEDMAGE